MLKRVEQLLGELIALPSVNPAFLPPGDANAGELRVAQFLGAEAAAAGLDIDFVEVLPGRPHLLARLSPRGRTRQRVLLAPHLDTVNGAPEQLVPRRSGGRIYGRGACDTKGSVAVMMSALCALARAGWRAASTEVCFVGLVDEEHRQLGSRALAAQGWKADLAIVGEPTQLQLVTAHKGALWITLETRGVSAHGSRPDLGQNAIREMARVVQALEGEYAGRLARRRHGLLGPATINVGCIQGGVQANIVPDRCVAQADRRTIPGERDAAVLRELRRFFAGQGLRVQVKALAGYPSLPLETDPRRGLVAGFLKVLGQKVPAGVHYFSDASVLAQGGIPSVVFGPGNIAQAHTRNEWVAVKELQQGQAALQRFLETLS